MEVRISSGDRGYEGTGGIMRGGWTIIERGRCGDASAMSWLADGLADGLAEPGRGPDVAEGPFLVPRRILPILKMSKRRHLCLDYYFDGCIFEPECERRQKLQ